MSYKLQKPYTSKQKCDFIVQYNHQQGLRIEEGANGLYALEPYEKIVDGVVIDNSEEYEQEQAKKEQDHINNLTMTALDLISFLQQSGLTLEQINAYLESNLEVKMQLTYCQNVYCGAVKQLMPITVGDVTITADMVEIAFRVKNGELVEKEDEKEEDKESVSE